MDGYKISRQHIRSADSLLSRVRCIVINARTLYLSLLAQREDNRMIRWQLEAVVPL